MEIKSSNNQINSSSVASSKEKPADEVSTTSEDKSNTDTVSISPQAKKLLDNDLITPRGPGGNDQPPRKDN